MTDNAYAVLRRRTYPLLAVGLVAALLALFGVAEVLHLPFLTDPVPALDAAGPLAGLLGVGLLVVDVLIPVPSSAVMTAHGAMFGAVAGACLSLLGGAGATVVAVWAGRRAQPVVARFALPEHRGRAERLFERYGTAAVVATRPVPVLAETVAVVAGTAGMSLVRAAVAGAAGNAMPAVLYALAGAAAVTMVGGFAVFGAVVLLAALFWLGSWITATRSRRACRG